MTRAIKIEIVGESLVFGSSGCLGSSFSNILHLNKIVAKKVDKTVPHFTDLHSLISAKSLQDVLGEFEIKNVFYFAGHSDVSTTNTSTSDEELATLKATINILNTLDSLKLFVYASSVLADSPKEYINSQKDPEIRNQLELYSTTKKRAESIICSGLKSKTLSSVLINRYTNVFGERPFGRKSLLSYILGALRSSAPIIRLKSPERSRVNFVFDRAVHARLNSYITDLYNINPSPVSVNYIALQNGQTLGELVNQVISISGFKNTRINYGSRMTFWDFFESASPLISPTRAENDLGIELMCRRFKDN